jgi:hypothetical protein
MQLRKPTFVIGPAFIRIGQVAERIYRLTAQGRLHVLGGRDPEQRWARHWDGQWRIVLFDLPVGRSAHRVRLWRYLRNRGFGYLQNSMWITPDPLKEEHGILTGGKIDVESLILLQARPCAGESDEQIVAGAWDFERINIRSVSEGAHSAACRAAAESGGGEGIARLDGSRALGLAQCGLERPLAARANSAAQLSWARAWWRRKKALQSAGDALRTFKPQ